VAELDDELVELLELEDDLLLLLLDKLEDDLLELLEDDELEELLLLDDELDDELLDLLELLELLELNSSNPISHAINLSPYIYDLKFPSISSSNAKNASALKSAPKVLAPASVEVK
jgi:hypothetical protein